MGDDAEKKPPLQEPYERFACNVLRSECYRRKLPVVKSGPHANTTKAGFLRLLRAADEQQRATCGDKQEKAKTVVAQAVQMEPVRLAEFPVSAPPPPPARAVSPPSSPFEFLPVPSRPPRMDQACGTKRTSPDERATNDSASKRLKAVEGMEQRLEQPENDGSLFSPQSSMTGTSSDESATLPTPPTSTTDDVQKNVSLVEPVAMPRWERLHARLEVVTAKLAQLQGRRDDWLPSASSSRDESDAEFYELMRRQLQRSLLECVLHT